MNKLIEKIVERIEQRKLANDECRKTALAKHNFDSVKYFRNLIFEDEIIISIIQEEAKAYNESVKGDLISRSVVIEWINQQREEVTKKQVAGTKESIFTRENLIDMQRCLSTFETFINKQPTVSNDGWIPCSKCSDCQHKECEKHGEI